MIGRNYGRVMIAIEIDSLKELLKSVRDGQLNIDEAVDRLKTLPFEDLGFAKVDHHRNLRNGYPESHLL
jgi:NCAIR mutase (PurE)-related protein